MFCYNQFDSYFCKLLCILLFLPILFFFLQLFLTVNVHFVNVVDVPGTDDVKPVPGTECVISRMAKKDNSSKYMLNGKNATFKAVAAELSKRNIDLNNNRFLILQGEVELISQMKPLGTKDGEVGLLEYLEDIIGSNQFVEPIKEASLKYDTAEETRYGNIKMTKNDQKRRKEKKFDYFLFFCVFVFFKKTFFPTVLTYSFPYFSIENHI